MKAKAIFYGVPIIVIAAGIYSGNILGAIVVLAILAIPIVVLAIPRIIIGLPAANRRANEEHEEWKRQYEQGSHDKYLEHDDERHQSVQAKFAELRQITEQQRTTKGKDKER